MAKGLEERSANTQHAELSHEEFVGLLVQDEKMYRDNLRLQRLLRKRNYAGSLLGGYRLPGIQGT